MKRTTKLRQLIESPELSMLMEVHNGMSAKIAEEAGFEGLWGSGLSISAACGVRDNNELSWTQVLDIIEYITDASSRPLLLDGDTGYGNFNNMRRLVKKLESRSCAGVCIEDKLFPKTNSFIDGNAQPLADIDEFCGKIKAGKDAQLDDDFVIVARVEAFIAGWGLEEALRRAEAYRAAGADAILIHSKLSKPDEVLAFKKAWGDSHPVVIVPTKYYSTPTDVFREAGFNVAIWANQLLRTSITSMQQAAAQIMRDENLVVVEENIVSVQEVFRLQGADELKEAERRYLPDKGEQTSAVILAASRGKELKHLTEDRPKAMLEIRGTPLLERLIATLNSALIKDITVVRGYKKDVVNPANVRFVDNDDFETTQEVDSLHRGLQGLSGEVLVSYGDLLFHKFVALHLLESQADFAICVDYDWDREKAGQRYTDLVQCSEAYDRTRFGESIELVRMTSQVDEDFGVVHGEWMGVLHMNARGTAHMQGVLSAHEDAGSLATLRMTELLNQLVESGQTVEVVYMGGHWMDVDELEDVIDAGQFGTVGQ
jgi:phosphoenolpyruvate phosphomutase